MSGVFKAIGSIASAVAIVTAVIPGLQPIAAIATAVSAVAGLGAAITARKPVSQRAGTQTTFKIDPGGPIPIVLGRTGVGGTVVHRATYGTDNHYKTYMVALSLGEGRSISFLADKVAVPFGGTQAIGYYNKWMWQDRRLGTLADTALGSGVTSPPYGTAGPVPNWGSAYRLSGIACTSHTMLFDTKSRRYASGEPGALWVVERGYVYDPRLDSTRPGGSGSCRWADPANGAAFAAARATWVYSETPALHGLMWRLGHWQRDESNSMSVNVKVAGIGAPIDLIDVAAIIASANVQEANGWKVGGQVDTSQEKWTVLKLIEEAGGAEPIANGALLSTLQKTPRTVLATIGAADLADGALTIPGMVPRRQRLNGYRARFRSEPHGWEMVDIDLVQVPPYVAADGGAKTGSGDFALVQDPDQCSELAAYALFDSREIGGIALPLKPKAMAWRLGDCLQFGSDMPGLSGLSAVVRSRSIDPATGIVTLGFSTETAGKHAACLGRTGVVPPAPALSLPTDEVPAPSSDDWNLAGTSFAADGATIPALVVTRTAGAIGNTNADAIVFDYRVHTSGMADDAGWSAASFEPPETNRKEITSVTPGTQYDVGVRYRVRGAVGLRLILGPVTTGDLVASGALQAAIANSFPVGLTISASDAGNVTISNHIRRYTDGHADVAITGTTLTGTGLGAGDFRAIAYDDLARAGGTVPYALYSDDIDARTSPSHPGRHYVGYVFIPTAGSPPSDGGGATPPGGHCVVEDTPLLIGPGEEKSAGEFVVGDKVYTRHEVTLGWGFYPVEAIEIVDSDDVWGATIGGRALRATGDHLVYVGSWTKLRDLSGAAHLAGTWRVVKLTVTSAHTYVSSGILSHNLKSISTE